MSQFMILLYSDHKNWEHMSPEEMQKAMEKYFAWGAKMRNTGRLISTHKLTDNAGRVMRGKDARVTDGPFTEGKEFLGGYYMFNADNYDHAVEISRDHPHLEFGGLIEVREIHVLPDSPNA